jgi:hypothetical protein
LRRELLASSAALALAALLLARVSACISVALRIHRKRGSDKQKNRGRVDPSNRFHIF